MPKGIYEIVECDHCGMEAREEYVATRSGAGFRMGSLFWYPEGWVRCVTDDKTTHYCSKSCMAKGECLDD